MCAGCPILRYCEVGGRREDPAVISILKGSFGPSLGLARNEHPQCFATDYAADSPNAVNQSRISGVAAITEGVFHVAYFDFVA